MSGWPFVSQWQDLFHDDKEIFLLALLCQDVFAIEQIGLGDFAVEGGELLLVDADASALRELAHFALRGETLRMLCQQIYCFLADGLLTAHLEVGHSDEDIEERLLVDSQQALLPMVQGPLTCVTIEHRKTQGDNAVVWTYDVDEATINIDLLNSNLPTVKSEILGTMSQPDGMSMLRTFVANGCALRYVYNGTSTGKRCEVYITTDDLRQALRNAGSTELTK